jgi:hypothetical protein
MSGPTIARTYGDVAPLVKAHRNSILEVNADGSIRAQNFKEKIGNLGLRITGRFTATKAEKDLKVAQAIRNLYQKAGNTDEGYFHPKNNKDYARFFNPQSLVKRSISGEIKGKVGASYVQAIKDKEVASEKVPAQKIFLSALSNALIKLSINPEYRQDSEALDGLSSACRAAFRHVNELNADAGLARLKEDLKGVDLQLGKGQLEEFDISKGVVEWAKKNAPKDLDRYTELDRRS